MLNHWAEFGQKALSENNIYVFNCCFLQNPLCEMMMRFNFHYDKIAHYIEELYCRIKALNPTVIYLKNTQVKERVTAIASERSTDWLHAVIDYHTSQGYGKQNQLTGFDGYITCLEKRQKIELQILNQLPIKQYIITNPFEDWCQTHKDIQGLLELV